MKKLTKSLLAISLLFGFAIPCMNLRANPVQKAEADSTNGAYHVISVAYWWASKPDNSYTCDFSVKESESSLEKYVTSTKNDFGTDKSDSSNYLCDFYTNTIPGYYSFTVTTNYKVVKTLGFLFQIYYKDELIFDNSPLIKGNGESFGFTWFSSDHTFSGSPLDNLTLYSYSLDNSNANNGSELLNNFDLVKNKSLPSINSQEFTQRDGSTIITAEKPTSDIAEVEFAGYFGTDSENNEYEMYYDKDCLPVKTSNLNADTTIKAMFKNNISLDCNGGEFVTPVTNVEKMLINDGYYLVGEQMELPEPVRDGYTFTGWTGDNGDVPEHNVVIPADKIEELSYTANWELNTYTIDYDLQDGEVLESNPTSYSYESESFTLNNPVKVNYTFIGWTGTGLTEPTLTVTIEKGSYGDRTYTANWEINKYTVSFVTGEGGSTVDDQEVEHGACAVKPADPTKEVEGIRYHFLGWFVDEVEFDFATPIIEPITLTAKWISYVDQFVLDYMHPEILPSDTGSGRCISEGWYLDAKTAFNELNFDERALFLINNEYKAYADRLIAWATAYGDGLAGQNLVNSSSLPNNVAENNNVITICIVACSVACTLICALIIIKRKQKITK
ncbi:MAG: InlB B-repeat-containing protein [Bacilli bacterium]|nr:InlB B-repeat-containing protein [Bacilli bacterium]